MKRFGISMTAALGMIVGFSVPAVALTPAETDAVVGIMEQLAEEAGQGMAADAGDIFYDYDQFGALLIPAAGFTEESWVVAYEAVVAGYLALVPEAEFRASFEEPLARLDASELPDEQKAAMRTHFDQLYAEAQAVRSAGGAYVDIVRPYEVRLAPLFGREE